MMRKNLQFSIQKPRSAIRKVFYAISQNPWFDYIITGCIVLNTITMTIKFHRMPEVMSNILEITNYVFAVIFSFEAVIKITG